MGVSLDREPIAVALAARIQARCPSLKIVTRRYRPLEQVDVSERPFAAVVVGAQAGTVRRGAPNLWKLQLPVYLYVHVDESDQTGAASTQLMALVKEIEDALERAPTEAPFDMSELYATNLGLANVFSCRLVSVETDEGLLQPDGLAVLTVEVEAAPG
jgi:hypothetical protein